MHIPDLIKVPNRPEFRRDPKSGAILNINSFEIESARKQKQERKKQERENSELKRKVENLSNDVSELKQMLQNILKKL